MKYFLKRKHCYRKECELQVCMCFMLVVLHFHYLNHAGKYVRVVIQQAKAGDPATPTSRWGILFADKSAIVTQLPEQLRQMMVVIVTVCAAFNLTVS